MRFGQDSVAFLKPEDNGGLMMEVEGESESGGEAMDTMIVYDPVDFDRNSSVTIV